MTDPLTALVERALATPYTPTASDRDRCIGREFLFDGKRTLIAAGFGLEQQYRIHYLRSSDRFQVELDVRGIWKPVDQPQARLEPCYGIIRAHWIAYVTRALGGGKAVAA